MSQSARSVLHDKACGRARFVADLPGCGHLFGALVTTRSAHCHVTVDLDGLRSLPGVVVAVDASTAPKTAYSTNPHGGSADTTVFAEVGRYAGDVVAAIACDSRVDLRHALTVAAEFVHETPRPPVLSIEQALTGDSLANPRYSANIVSESWYGASIDDAAAALAAAPLLHTTTSHVDPSPHGFLERLAASAEYVGDRWLVRSPTQCPAMVRDILSGLFNADVELEPVLVGGGFGGKEEVTVEPAAMALSAAAGGARVLLETTRRQMTALFRSRHGGHITLSTGFDAEGRFLARTVDVVFEAGPYDGHSSTVSRHAAMAAAQLYPRGVVSARSRAVATNRLPGGAFRGYGCIQSGFAVETHVDEIARLVGLDPYRIRLLNVARTGDPDPTSGVPFRDVKATECLTQLQESDRSAELDPTVGRGVAVVVATSAAAGPAGPDRAEVACRWDPHTGTVVIETAVADVGQGMTILLSQLAAEVLGIDESRVAVEIVARNRGIRDPGMFGSRGANVTGSALVRAAGELKRALIKQAASRIGLTSAAEDAQIDPGWEVIHFASDSVKLSELDEVRTVGAYETSDSGLAWGAVRVLARCDETTGQVELVQVASVHDVGVLLDELGARGQVHGGVVQGIGAALSERASFLADGSVAETGFLNHLIPTNAALPETIIGFLPSPARPDGRTGAKGIGEAAIMGVPAAIANAVADVTGAPMRQLPLTPERVLRALKADHARRVEAR